VLDYAPVLENSSGTTRCAVLLSQSEEQTQPVQTDKLNHPAGIAFRVHRRYRSGEWNPSKRHGIRSVLAGFGGSPNPAPGRPIVDGARAAPWDLDFLSPDGTQIGTIHIDGFVGGMRPPGAPKEIAGCRSGQQHRLAGARWISYRVDFRVSDGTTAGTAAIRLTAAWIAGPPVNVPVR